MTTTVTSSTHLTVLSLKSLITPLYFYQLLQMYGACTLMLLLEVSVFVFVFSEMVNGYQFRFSPVNLSREKETTQ